MSQLLGITNVLESALAATAIGGINYKDLLTTRRLPSFAMNRVPGPPVTIIPAGNCCSSWKANSSMIAAVTARAFSRFTRQTRLMNCHRKKAAYFSSSGKNP
jgi:hypothetical protein